MRKQNSVEQKLFKTKCESEHSLITRKKCVKNQTKIYFTIIMGERL